MPRPAKSKPAGLTINSKLRTVDEPPKSSPMNLEGIDLSSFGGDFSSGLLDLPPLPQSPPASPQPPQQRDLSKTFLSNNSKTRIATDEAQRADPPKIRQVRDDDELRPGSSSVSKIYHLRKQPGSTPELSLLGSAENVHKESNEVDNTQIPDSRPHPSPHQSEDSVSVKRKEKGFRNPLSRSKSTRRDSNSKSRPTEKPSFDQAPKTAPLSNDWSNSDNMFLKARNKEKRGKSAERAVASESEDNERPSTKDKDKDKGGFVSGSKSALSKAKTGGGHFLTRLGKIGRSASNNEREIPDSEYEIKVINLPLIEQTRITRISKDLVSCKDKTEYWMPALPWRCIDYLNLNCESEGLYRVPGSGPQVKYWQRRFDTELDVDLLDERDLYDQNNIGSMLKSWLRDLPTEIFPKARQHALAEELAKENTEFQKMGQQVPQKLRDALSDLPPFNYYLLFAITCHLSLLLSHTEKNKMDLNNLSICIGPCLELERWLFNYLVGDWRHCWQGCYTEKQYLEVENAHEQGLEYQPPTTDAPQAGVTAADTKKSASENVMVDERAVHSSGSSDNAGRQGSQDTYARSTSRPRENTKPDGYGPQLAKKDTNGRLASPERKPVPNKRPSTAQGGEKKPSVDSTNGSVLPKPKAPSHNRSQSDLPLAPIKTNEPIDMSSFNIHPE